MLWSQFIIVFATVWVILTVYTYTKILWIQPVEDEFSYAGYVFLFLFTIFAWPVFLATANVKVKVKIADLISKPRGGFSSRG